MPRLYTFLPIPYPILSIPSKQKFQNSYSWLLTPPSQYAGRRTQDASKFNHMRKSFGANSNFFQIFLLPCPRAGGDPVLLLTPYSCPFTLYSLFHKHLGRIQFPTCAKIQSYAQPFWDKFQIFSKIFTPVLLST